jgi:hypothetical protein
MPEREDLYQHEHAHSHEHTHSHEHVHSHEHAHSHADEHEHAHSHDRAHGHDHGHEHSHEHSHEHAHEHSHSHSGDDQKRQLLALLLYLADHNIQHVEELNDLSRSASEKGFADVAEQINEAIGVYHKGNAVLNNAYQLLQEKGD